MSCGRYILENGQPREEPDLIKWARWFGAADRKVAKNTVGEAKVSTVFLGLDHGKNDAGGILLFETMVFGGKDDGMCLRYSTIEAARSGHGRVVAQLVRRAAIKLVEDRP